jgi:hypothetical protein
LHARFGRLRCKETRPGRPGKRPVPTPVNKANLHAVAVHGIRPLGVECRGCAIAAWCRPTLGACHGSMTPLATLNFVCKLCGARAFDLFLFNGDEADGWVHTASGPSS